MEIIKPELTQTEREQGNKLFCFLEQQTRPIDKQTMCEFMGWEYNQSNERKIRLVLANIAKVRPIISTSDQKGYKVAKMGDLEDVKHQWAEIDSRIKELEARKAPLVNFYEKYSGR